MIAEFSSLTLAALARWGAAALLTAHLLAVGVAGAGPLLAGWLQWSARRRSDARAEDLAWRYAILCGWALLGGVALGGLLWGWQWQMDRPSVEAWRRVEPSRWGFAAGEVVFSALCLAIWLRIWRREGRGWMAARLALAVLAATNLLYHFPPLFTMIALMRSRGGLSQAVLDRALYLKFLGDAELQSRVVHHWLAATAAAGLAVVWQAGGRRSPESPAADLGAATGARVALVACGLQIPVGLWVLSQVSTPQQERLLGADPWAAGLLGVGVAATLVLVQVLWKISVGEEPVKARRWATAILALIVFVMVLAGERLNG